MSLVTLPSLRLSIQTSQGDAATAVVAVVLVASHDPGGTSVMVEDQVARSSGDVHFPAFIEVTSEVK